MKNILTLILLISFIQCFAQNNSSVKQKQATDPSVFVAGSTGGKISASAFKAVKNIGLIGADSSYSIVSYSILFKGNGFEGDPVFYEHVKGYQLTQDILFLLKKCKPGTIVTIGNIKVKKNNSIKQVPAATYTLQ